MCDNLNGKIKCKIYVIVTKYINFEIFYYSSNMSIKKRISESDEDELLQYFTSIINLYHFLKTILIETKGSNHVIDTYFIAKSKFWTTFSTWMESRYIIKM